MTAYYFCDVEYASYHSIDTPFFFPLGMEKISNRHIAHSQTRRTAVRNRARPQNWTNHGGGWVKRTDDIAHTYCIRTARNGGEKKNARRGTREGAKLPVRLDPWKWFVLAPPDYQFRWWILRFPSRRSYPAPSSASFSRFAGPPDCPPSTKIALSAPQSIAFFFNKSVISYTGVPSAERESHVIVHET